MDNIEKLKSLLTLVNESITKKDFEESFRALMDFVKKLKLDLTDKNSQTVEELKALINQLAERLENLNQEKLGEAQEKINKALKEQEVGMNFIRDKVRKIKEGKDGAPGVSPDPHIVALEAQKLTLQAVKPDLLTISQVNENLSKQGDLIVDTLSKQVDEEKIHIEDIFKLREELDELRQLRGKSLGGGGLRPAPTGVETPVGAIDGANTAYTVTFVPQYITLQGQAIYPDNGYVLSSSSGILTITLDDAPLVGNILRSHY